MQLWLPLILAIWSWKAAAINQFVQPPASVSSAPPATYYTGQTIDIKWTTDFEGDLGLALWQNGLDGFSYSWWISTNIPSTQSSFLWTVWDGLDLNVASDLFQLGLLNGSDSGDFSFFSANFSIVAASGLTSSNTVSSSIELPSSRTIFQPTTVISSTTLQAVSTKTTKPTISSVAPSSSSNIVALTPSATAKTTIPSSPSQAQSSVSVLNTFSNPSTISSFTSSTISTATALTQSTSLPTSAPPSSPSVSSSGLSTTAKIGMGLGVPAGLVALLGIGLSTILVVRKNKKRNAVQPLSPTLPGRAPAQNKVGEWRSELHSNSVIAGP